MNEVISFLLLQEDLIIELLTLILCESKFHCISKLRNGIINYILISSRVRLHQKDKPKPSKFQQNSGEAFSKPEKKS